MEINKLTGISSEQLTTMLMMENLQTANYSNGKTSEGNNLAFALLMKNLIDAQNSSSQSRNDNIADSNKASQSTVSGRNLNEMPMMLNGYSRAINTNSSLTQSNNQSMKRIYDAVNDASSKYGIDPNLILGIIKNESDFNPNVTSCVGAAGLMQVMPENFSSVGITDGYNIEQNINGGTKILKKCLDMFSGDVEMALMAYGAGAGTMKKRGVTCAADLYKMPEETRNAVPRVMSYYNEFKNNSHI